MRISILFAVAIVLSARPARADVAPQHRVIVEDRDAPMRPDDVDGPGNGLQLELNVFRESGVYSTDAILLTGTGTGGTATVTYAQSLVSSVQPLVLFGYQFDQNAVLLGIGVATLGSTNFFGVSPTYRRYLSPLRTGKVSAFAEGGFTVSIIAPSGSTTWGIGVDVGAGAEWLFVRNFGLFGKAQIAYGHVNLPGGSGGNVDAAGLQGDVGLAVHL